ADHEPLDPLDDSVSYCGHANPPGRSQLQSVSAFNFSGELRAPRLQGRPNRKAPPADADHKPPVISRLETAAQMVIGAAQKAGAKPSPFHPAIQHVVAPHFERGRVEPLALPIIGDDHQVVAVGSVL